MNLLCVHPGKFHRFLNYITNALLCCDCSLSVTEYKHVYSISSTLNISQHSGFLFEIFPKLTRWCFWLKPKAMVLNTANIGSCLNPGTPNIRMHQTTVFSLKKWHLLFGRSEPKQLGQEYTNTQNKCVAPQSELRWHNIGGGIVEEILCGTLESNPNFILCPYGA